MSKELLPVAQAKVTDTKTATFSPRASAITIEIVSMIIVQLKSHGITSAKNINVVCPPTVSSVGLTASSNSDILTKLFGIISRCQLSK